MRLKITIDAKDKLIPYEYHGFLQGVIYHALNESNGTFFHDQGFSNENRVYKLFVFSELIGKYTPTREGLIFKELASFYVSCVSSEFMNELYAYFHSVNVIALGKQYFEVISADPVEDEIYHDDHEYILQTLSPITCYKTDEKHFTTYFHAKSQDFEESLCNNLARKYLSLFDDNKEEYFKINEVIKCKEVKVKFKKSVYVAYTCTMKVCVSDNYLKLLLHTGLGSKNAAGFGMVKIVK